MIPYSFQFIIKSSNTGNIFDAKLTDDFDNPEYHITGHGIDCKYTVKEVMAFLSNGNWKEVQYFIGADFENEI